MKAQAMKAQASMRISAVRTSERVQIPPEPWDPISKLDEVSRNRLSEADKALVRSAMQELHAYVRKTQMPYVPVFGYLSLVGNNHRELGKKSQADVVPGRDFVPAHLRAHGIDFVASTLYRGTPEHPGVIAGLSPRKGVRTPGVVLRIPIGDETEALLAELIRREFVTESDLRDQTRPSGERASNTMYAPKLVPVHYEDKSVGRALVFLSNPNSAKVLGGKSVFADNDQRMSPGRLAYFMSSVGGFRRDSEEKIQGGLATDYWNGFYVNFRHQPDQTVTEALKRAKLVPSDERIAAIVQRAPHDPHARAVNDALLTILDGAAVPLQAHQLQRSEQELKLQRLPAKPHPEPSDDEILRFASELTTPQS